MVVVNTKTEFVIGKQENCIVTIYLTCAVKKTVI